MIKALQKWLVDTPKRSEESFPDHIRAKRNERRKEGYLDITVQEKDYRYDPPRIKPYTYKLVKPLLGEEKFRKNVHYLSDLEEEPGKPVDGLRKEGVPGKGPLPCLIINNSITPLPKDGK